MVTKLPPRNFAQGEIAPWLDGLPGYERGARTIENFIVRKNGAAVRRPGTLYAGTIKNSADDTILVDVTVDTSNVFVLEVGNVYIRFWNRSTHAVVGGVGSEYEITSPWSTGELSDLMWTYQPEEKAVYWVHPKHAMRKLTYTSTADWAISIVDLWTQPPWLFFHNARSRVFEVDSFNVPPTELSGSLYPGKLAYAVDAEYNSRVYVALLFNGTDSEYDVVVSADGGVTWTLVDTAAPVTIGAVVPNEIIGVNTQGKIIIAAGSVALYSSDDDGLTWYTTSVVGSAWDTVGYSPDNDTWRVLGGDSTALYCRYSADNGYTWVSVTVNATGSLSAPGVVSGIKAANNLWVAWVERSLTNSGTILTASTGLVTQQWSVTLEVANPVHGIAYGEPAGTPLWLAIVGTSAYSSSNALAWASVGSPGVALDKLEWTGNRFVGIHAAASGTFWWSSDDNGVTWEKHEQDVGSTKRLLPNSFWGTKRYQNMAVLAAPVQPPGQPVFNLSGTFPSAIASHEGRLYIARTTDKPGTLWASKAGEFENIYLGETAETAFEYELLGAQNIDIQWMIGGNELVVGTRTAEGILRGEPGVGITPKAASYKWVSGFGSKRLRPVRAGNQIVFAQRGGAIIRSLVPEAGENAWQSPDLTAEADHITRSGVVDLDKQEDPFSMLWMVMANGRVATCTYDGTGRPAWAQQVIGRWECIQYGDCETTNIPRIVNESGTPTSVNTTAARSSDQAHKGTYSFKHTKTSAVGAGDANQWFHVGNQFTNLHGIVAGGTYEVSFWVYIPTDQAVDASEVALIVITWLSSAHASIERVAAAEIYDAWQELKITVTLPDTMEGFYFRIGVQNTAPQNSYIYYDDVSLKGPRDLVKSIAVVPTDSEEDEVWMIVKRDIAGTFYQFVEYMDKLEVTNQAAGHFFDSGKVYFTTETSTVDGLSHLAGETVQALLDGRTWVSDLTVAAGGTVALGASGINIHVGLPFDSYLQTMRIPATGQKKLTGRLYVWVRNSIGGSYGPDLDHLEVVEYSGVALATDALEVPFPGLSDRDGYIWVVQSNPWPLEIVALGTQVTVGDI